METGDDNPEDRNETPPSSSSHNNNEDDMKKDTKTDNSASPEHKTAEVGAGGECSTCVQSSAEDSQHPNTTTTTTSCEAHPAVSTSSTTTPSQSHNANDTSSTAGKDEQQDDAITEDQPPISFCVMCNKKKHDVQFSPSRSIKELKSHLETTLGIPPAMQKLMFKAKQPSDDQSLLEVGIIRNSKVMVIGSTVEALLTVTQPKEQDLKQDSLAGIQKKEPLSQQKMHRKVLDKGKPDDVLPGIKNIQESLPLQPLSGMLNKHGGKVRLTFKLELDQMWISTKERTDKIPMGSIKGLVSEPIEGEEQYHVMGIQLGPTEASRYWVYWVPAQYVNSIYVTVLGRPYHV